MNCGMKFVRYLLYGFNFLFIIFAFVLIGVGGAVEIKFRDIVTVTDQASIVSAPILMIIIGVFILFMALIGCCGAQKENYCMITTYTVIMVILLILEFAATITAYAMKDKIEEIMDNYLVKAMSQYTKDHQAPIGFIQENFQCCGSSGGPQDWANSETWQAIARNETTKNGITNPRDPLVPDGCCEKMFDNCGLRNDTVIWQSGCIVKIEESFHNKSLEVGGVGISVILIQIIGILFGCLLMRSTKPSYEIV